jgi:outer membrane protein assembly factor BamB
VAVGESVFVFSREGGDEVVRRLALANGRELWKKRYPAPYQMDPAAQGHGEGPKSTPLYHGGLLYTLGISGILSCFEARTGDLRWRHTFARQFRTTSPQFGAAMSPVAEKGLVIAHVGGHDDGALTAFDAKTGRVRWRWTGDGPAYASPILVTLGGVRQIVTQTQKLCIGVNPATGKLLWRVPFTTPYDQNCVSPVAVGETVVFGGTQKPTFACRVRRNGDGWTAEKVWETREVTLYMSTPVAMGNRLYGMSERQRGQLFSLNASTGKVEWMGPGRFGENAALTAVGAEGVLVLSTGAELRLFKRQGVRLAEVARYPVADSPTWASPAVLGNRVLVKDTTMLALWEMAA